MTLQLFECSDFRRVASSIQYGARKEKWNGDFYHFLPNAKAEPHAASDFGKAERPQSRVLARASGSASFFRDENGDVCRPSSCRATDSRGNNPVSLSP